MSNRNYRKHNRNTLRSLEQRQQQQQARQQQLQQQQQQQSSYGRVANAVDIEAPLIGFGAGGANNGGNGGSGGARGWLTASVLVPIAFGVFLGILVIVGLVKLDEHHAAMSNGTTVIVESALENLDSNLNDVLKNMREVAARVSSNGNALDAVKREEDAVLREVFAIRQEAHVNSGKGDKPKHDKVAHAPMMGQHGWRQFGQDERNQKHGHHLQGDVRRFGQADGSPTCSFDIGDPANGMLPTRPIGNPVTFTGASATLTHTELCTDEDGCRWISCGTTWSGYVFCFETETCHLIWKKDIASDVMIGQLGRPAVDPPTERSRNAVAMFEYRGNSEEAPEPAGLFCTPVDRSVRDVGYAVTCVAVSLVDGHTLWMTPVCDSAYTDRWCYGARPTASPSVYGDHAYWALSGSVGLGRGLSAVQGSAVQEWPMMFRGKNGRLNLQTGVVDWFGYTMPNNTANNDDFDPDTADPRVLSGGGSWGSAPTVLAARGLVAFSSGNTYLMDPFLEACMTAPGYDPAVTPFACLTAWEAQCALDHPTWSDSDCRIMANAIILRDMETGEVVAYDNVMGVDPWTLGCVGLGLQHGTWPGCAARSGPDWDFGQAPVMVPARKGMPLRLVAINKGGIAIVWAVHTDVNGVVTMPRMFFVNAAKGSTLGGGQWIIAYDPHRDLVQLISTGNPTRCASDNVTVCNSNAPIDVVQLLPDGRYMCNGGMVMLLNPNTGMIERVNISPYARLSDGPVDYRCDSDPELSSMDNDDSTEKYKRGFTFNPIDPYADTVMGALCAPKHPVGVVPHDEAGSRFHGGPGSFDGVCTVPAMDGSVFGYDSKTLDCEFTWEGAGGAMYGGLSGAGRCVTVGSGYRQISFQGPGFPQHSGNTYDVWCSPTVPIAA